MTTFQAIVLGIVQGLGEFLPISSSGHLVVMPWLLGWPEPGLAFDVALHVGTLAAVLYAFAERLACGSSRRRLRGALPRPAVRGAGRPPARGSSPWPPSRAAIAGLLLEDWAETTFRSPRAGGGDHGRDGRRALPRRPPRPAGTARPTRAAITLRDALLIGCAQALAIVPGVSRSGATISMALFLGYRREEAARFSFLLATPITSGPRCSRSRTCCGRRQAHRSCIGMVAAGVVGFLSIRVLLAYVRTRDYRPFVVLPLGLRRAGGRRVLVRCARVG